MNPVCLSEMFQNTKLCVCNELLESACLNVCKEKAPHHDLHMHKLEVYDQSPLLAFKLLVGDICWAVLANGPKIESQQLATNSLSSASVTWPHSTKPPCRGH